MKDILLLCRKHTSMIGTNIGMVIASVVICTAVCVSTRESAFECFEQSKVVLFAYVMAVLWTGFFNTLLVYNAHKTYTEADFGNRHYAPIQYLVAVVMIEAILCAFESVISSFVFYSFFRGEYHSLAIVTGSFIIDFILSVFFITFSSMCLGMLIGILFDYKHIAISIPFILVIQLLFSGGIFDLPKGDVLNAIAKLCISRYGVGALGALLDMNSYPFSLSSVYPIQQPYYDIYEPSTGNVINCWIRMLLLGLQSLILSYILLSHRAKKVSR
ncbi:MAG: ABC transporter permease [Lachnospiraceae bacterium]|nr:ABC transporter permease [Lachnospiraceae bacterium]